MRKFAWILLLALGHGAHGTSFDCTKAKTPHEKAICSSKELSAADDRMAATYRAVLAAAATAEIRADQQRWVRGMEAACSGNLPFDALTACLSKYYLVRIQALQHMVAPEYHVTSGSLFQTVMDERQFAGLDRVGPPKPGNSVESAVTWVAHTGGDDQARLPLDLWPQPLPPDWKEWTRTLEVAARDWAFEGLSDWRKDADMLGDMHVSAEVGVVTDWLVTTSIRRYWKQSQPHGDLWGDHSVEVNWLLKEHRRIHPEDIFRAGSGWDKDLLTRCDVSLRKEFRVYDSAAYQPALQEIVSEPSHWHFEKGGLAIFEVKGQSLLDPIRIKWDDLKPFLRQDRVLQQQN